MARLKPKSPAAIGGLTDDQIWWLKFADIGMPVGAPDFPFESWDDARLAWFRHREELLRTKYPTSGPFFGETEFDDAYAQEREERRLRLEERANARR